MDDIPSIINNSLIVPGHHREIAKQINKDFGSFGETVYSNPETIRNYEELFKPLFDSVSSLLDNDRGKMMQIIYRVDISENNLGKALTDVRKASAADVLTKMVIEREYQKIVLRSKSL